MVKVHNNLQMGINTLVLMSKASHMDTENTFGQMETHTKDNLSKVQGKEMVLSVNQMDKCMKDNLKMIQNMGWVYKNTNQGSNLLENSSRASDLRAS